MLDGRILATGLAEQKDCAPSPYKIIDPTSTNNNLALVGLAIQRWTVESHDFAYLHRRGQLTIDVVDRADFAVQVLTIINTNLLIGVCCQVLAIDPDDNILAAGQFTYVPPTEATINFVAVEPRNIPSSPYVRQVRGLGTAIVANIARHMLKNQVTTVYLHPLDADARRFWIGRGFGQCGAGSLLCIRGVDKIQHLIDGCIRNPETPDKDQLLCGLPARVRSRMLVAR